jgi:hypothetical protein
VPVLTRCSNKHRLHRAAAHAGNRIENWRTKRTKPRVSYRSFFTGLCDNR